MSAVWCQQSLRTPGGLGGCESVSACPTPCETTNGERDTGHYRSPTNANAGEGGKKDMRRCGKEQFVILWRLRNHKHVEQWQVRTSQGHRSLWELKPRLTLQDVMWNIHAAQEEQMLIQNFRHMPKILSLQLIGECRCFEVKLQQFAEGFSPLFAPFHLVLLCQIKPMHQTIL